MPPPRAGGGVRQLTPARRLRLHREAALLVGDERAALHHRAEATPPPDDALAAELRAPPTV